MKVYDALAGKYGFAKSRHLSREQVLQHIPTLEQDGLRGGVLYFDGQFDDARLLIDLARTADDQGAALLNYAPVVSFGHDDGGFVDGLEFVDLETNQHHTLRARAVVNATGAFTDAVRQMDDADALPMIAPSQGVHVMLDRSFLPGDAAIMVPRTSDGRVMFAIPWHDHAVGIQQMTRDDPAMANPLHERLPICVAQVAWAVRHEMARTVDDVLARRTRALVLDAKAAIEMAPAVARLMAVELRRDLAWQQRQVAEFQSIAGGYFIGG